LRLELGFEIDVVVVDDLVEQRLFRTVPRIRCAERRLGGVSFPPPLSDARTQVANPGGDAELAS
jgi:hypothetical protein